MDRLNDSNKIMHQIFLIKGFQLVRIVAVIYFLSYFLGTLWFVMTKHTSTISENGYTFYNEYDLGNLSASENLTIVIYFMFTTLSTVGLGDYNPKSETERLLMCLMLMCGVTCFSYIMSVLTSIVYEVQTATKGTDESEALSRWLLLLRHFNKSKPLPADMIEQFETYFEYYWRNNKNSSVMSVED